MILTGEHQAAVAGALHLDGAGPRLCGGGVELRQHPYAPPRGQAVHAHPQPRRHQQVPTPASAVPFSGAFSTSWAPSWAVADTVSATSEL